jgi:transcriptional regulator with XRE-family HTH domain
MPQLGAGGPRVSLRRIAEALEEAQQRSGMSYRDIARMLELSPSTLTRIRQGHRPDADTLAVLMAWLQLSTTDVLARNDPALEARIPGSRFPERVIDRVSRRRA